MKKAALFARDLKKVYQPFPSTPINNNVKEILHTPFQLELPLKIFKIKQVKNIIKTKFNPQNALELRSYNC